MIHDSSTAGRLPLGAQRRNTDIASVADHLQSDLFHLNEMLENYAEDVDAGSLRERFVETSLRLESTWRRRDVLSSSSTDDEYDVSPEEIEAIRDARGLRDEGIDLLAQLQARLQTKLAGAGARALQAGEAQD